MNIKKQALLKNPFDAKTAGDWEIIFLHITEGGYSDDEIIGILQIIDANTEIFTPALTGAVSVVRGKMKNFPISEAIRLKTIDVCGTGGDAPKTGGSLNISTATAFVTAACGVFVAKHGNRSVSSRSGSADMLEAAGVPISLSPYQAAACLEKNGLCFLFAPDYHPALRHAASARKRYGRPSLFNFIGPLCNPARPTAQLIGVFDFSRAQAVVKASGLEKGYIVTGGDGSDEPDLSPNNRMIDMQGNKISLTAQDMEEAGLFLSYAPGSLQGGEAAYNAEALMQLLKNDPAVQAYQDTVLLSSAFALMAAERETNFQAAIALAREGIVNGAALDLFFAIRNFK